MKEDRTGTTEAVDDTRPTGEQADARNADSQQLQWSDWNDIATHRWSERCRRLQTGVPGMQRRTSGQSALGTLEPTLSIDMSGKLEDVETELGRLEMRDQRIQR